MYIDNLGSLGWESRMFIPPCIFGNLVATLRSPQLPGGPPAALRQGWICRASLPPHRNRDPHPTCHGKIPPKKNNICHLIMGKTWKNIKKWIEIAPGRIRYQVCLLYKQKPSCSGPLIRKHLERSWVGQIILYHISNYNCNTNVRWIRLANGFPYNGSI